MKTLMFALLVCGCGGTTTEIRTERVGCMSDVECDDQEEDTSDWCEPESGICNHERAVATSCNDFEECDDGNPASVDRCVDGVCHHDHETNVFDPAAPERQDAQLICEQPVQGCSWPQDQPYAEVSFFARCFNDRLLWNEDGYPFLVGFHNFEQTRTLRVRPQLRVGDPRDRYVVTVVLNSLLTEPVLTAEMSVSEIEAGLEIIVDPAEIQFSYDAVIFMTLQPVGTVLSRSIQWGLPADGVIDIDTGETLTTCLSVGEFMDVPEHGFLHLGEGPNGEPVCDGEVVQADYDALAEGWVREQSNPRIYYAGTMVYPARIFSFATLRELLEWVYLIQGRSYRFGGAYSYLCGGIGVVPDGSIAEAEYERENIGFRPGSLLQWTDQNDGLVHKGVADADFTILDMGVEPVQGLGGGYCTSYYELMSEEGGGCFLEVSDLIASYTRIPSDSADASELYDRSSLWTYNQE